MVQTASRLRKEDVRSISAEQGCSHTELGIVGNNNNFSDYRNVSKELIIIYLKKLLDSNWLRAVSSSVIPVQKV